MLTVEPDATADEVAAITAALALLWPSASAPPAHQIASSWRFSGRHWSASTGWNRRRF